MYLTDGDLLEKLWIVVGGKFTLRSTYVYTFCPFQEHVIHKRPHLNQIDLTPCLGWSFLITRFQKRHI